MSVTADGAAGCRVQDRRRAQVERQDESGPASASEHGRVGHF